MIMKGQKRKLPQEEVEDVDVCWENQRRFVFSVSLNKYQQSQDLPEPSLRRSVLIANTLRQVSMEACSSPPPPREATASSGEATWEHWSGHSVAVTTAADCPSVSLPEPEEDWESMSADPDLSITAAISSIITALECSAEAPAAPRTPLRSLENLESSTEVKYGVRVNGSWGLRDEDTSVEALKSSYLHDVTMEDLFQDIDTSLLERDMGVLGLRASGEDLLMYLPPYPSSSQSTKCLPSFSSFASPVQSFSSQSPLREGLDLDHLMEILVES